MKLTRLIPLCGLLLFSRVAHADTNCWDERGECWTAVEGISQCTCEDGNEVGEEWTGITEEAACEKALNLCGDPLPGIKSTCHAQLRGRCIVRYNAGEISSSCSCVNGDSGSVGPHDGDAPTPTELEGICIQELEATCEKHEPGPDRVDCEAEWGKCWVLQDGRAGCRCDETAWTSGFNPDNQTVLAEAEMVNRCDENLIECKGSDDDDDGDNDDDSDDDDDASENSDQESSDPTLDVLGCSVASGVTPGFLVGVFGLLLGWRRRRS